MTAERRRCVGKINLEFVDDFGVCRYALAQGQTTKTQQQQQERKQQEPTTPRASLLPSYHAVLCVATKWQKKK